MKIVRPMTVGASALLSSNVAETAALYSSGTTYAANAIVRQDAADGSRLYQSAVGSNTNNPLTDTAKWIPLGATNRWKAFDGSVTSQAANANSIQYVIKADGRIDSVVIMNVDAVSVRVVAEDTVDGVVFDETHNLVSASGITDLFGWLTEPIERLADKLITGLPILYADLKVTVTISAPGGTAKCGAVVVGLAKQIGGTQYGAQVGIKDYSVKGADDFGNIVPIERAYSKRANLSVMVDNSLVDQLQILLSRYRATPIVYVGAESFGSTVVYGFYRDASVELRFMNHSILSIEIEGLT